MQAQELEGGGGEEGESRVHTLYIERANLSSIESARTRSKQNGWAKEKENGKKDRRKNIGL